MNKVILENAIGRRLIHDVTEVSPKKGIKGPAFKRGHVIATEDIETLHNLGKNFIYVWNENSDEVHEDDAALFAAPLMAGDNIRFDPEPSEGKIAFYATCPGLFKVDKERLYQINALEIPSLPTLHNNFPVTEGKQVAAFRIIPLTCDPSIIEKVGDILKRPLISIKPFLFSTAAIIVTGNEVFHNRIQDAFIPKIRQKLAQYQVTVSETEILPDEVDRIHSAIERLSSANDIVFVTGGTSVDPDDVTVKALRMAGVKYEVKGNPIQPGNNFTIGYKGKVAVCAVPAAGLHYKATALDVFLPRLLAGEQVTKEDIYSAGHGGLCHLCDVCHFPICPFSIGS